MAIQYTYYYPRVQRDTYCSSVGWMKKGVRGVFIFICGVEVLIYLWINSMFCLKICMSESGHFPF